MSFEIARKVADAVLLEGYVLYPYRASSTKNRFRWSFGVLAPRAWSEAGGCEHWWTETQCLVEASGAAHVDGKLRFLQVQQRQIEELRGDSFHPVESLDCGGRLWVPWEEGELREIDFRVDLSPGAPAEDYLPFAVEGGTATEEIRDQGGALRGRVVRERRPLSGALRIAVHQDDGLRRVSIRVENVTPWPELSAARDRVMSGSCIAAHLILSVRGGAFVSLLDPPERAARAAQRCTNVRTFPVLVGAEGRRDVVLSSPIILYDYPLVAPESPGDFFDATEIDELLTLRTATLTPEEKREARATDPRAAEIVDRVDALPEEMMSKLHGALRDLRDGEMIPRRGPDRPSDPNSRFRPGMKVRLRPGNRRTDAQDALFAGMIATVQQVLRDVEDREWLAVTIDGDPAAELNHWYGRFHYYYPDEVELLEAVEETAP